MYLKTFFYFCTHFYQKNQCFNTKIIVFICVHKNNCFPTHYNFNLSAPTVAPDSELEQNKRKNYSSSLYSLIYNGIFLPFLITYGVPSSPVIDISSTSIKFSGSIPINSGYDVSDLTFLS